MLIKADDNPGASNRAFTFLVRRINYTVRSLIETIRVTLIEQAQEKL